MKGSQESGKSREANINTFRRQEHDCLLSPSTASPAAVAADVPVLQYLSLEPTVDMIHVIVEPGAEREKDWGSLSPLPPPGHRMIYL